MSKRQAKQSMGSMEFVQWQIFLDQKEMEGFDPIHYYLARLTRLFVQANSKDSKSLKDADFLMKFVKNKPIDPKQEISLEEKKRRMMMSRGAWASALGIKIDVSDLTDGSDVLKFPGVE